MNMKITIRDVTLILLALAVVCLLMRDAYDMGAEDGYWEALETDMVCEIFT